MGYPWRERIWNDESDHGCIRWKSDVWHYADAVLAAIERGRSAWSWSRLTTGWKLFRSGVIAIAQCARSGDCSISGHSCRRIRPESAEARSVSINRVNREVAGSVTPVALEVGNRQVYELDNTLVYRRIRDRRQIVIWQYIPCKMRINF